MRVRPIIVAAAATLTTLVAASAASAHPAKVHAREALRVVRPEVGPPLLTHGQDPLAAAETRASRAAGVGFDTGDAERQPLCAAGNYQHVLYARPAGAVNRLAEVRPALIAVLRRMNAVLNAESLASGGPTADYRVRCDGSGRPAIDAFATTSANFDGIVADARRAGFAGSAADYLIFYDAARDTACGVASYVEDERLSAANASNTGGGYGLVYRPCWFTEIPMHEVGHTMGAVQYSAPHSTGIGGHCNQENDVICYAPDGGDRNQSAVQSCPGTPRFDCGFDDYFDARPEFGEYLASHWNLGSPLNAFISFGVGDHGGLGDLIGAVADELLGAGRRRGATRAAAGKPGEWRMFEIAVTRRARALVVRVRDAASMSLYVRRMKQPTERSHACHARARRAKAVCRIRKPRQGKWIAGVRNHAADPGAEFRIRAAIKRARRR